MKNWSAIEFLNRIKAGKKQEQGLQAAIVKNSALVQATGDAMLVKAHGFHFIFLLLSLILASLISGMVQAQTFRTTVSQNKIGKNQFAEVVYEIAEGERIEDFQAPVFRDWEVVSGPNNSSFQSIYNGKSSRRTSISYYLQPKKTGKLVIEGARAVVDGKTLNSNAAIVEVLNKTVNEPQQNSNSINDPLTSLFDDPFGSQAQAPPQQRQDDDFAMAQVLRAGEDINKKISDNVMLKVITSKNSCYEGEPIVATYKIYTRLDLINPDFAKRPSFSGFSAYDMDEVNQDYSIEQWKGKNYRVYTYRKVQLYALQSGTLTLDPVELDFNVKFFKYEAVAGGGFDPNNSNSYIQKAFALTSAPTNINVLPLPPTSKPVAFKGAVGDFSITASADATETGKDDAITLHVKITGSGNFSMVHAPAVQWPHGMEAYDPEEKENLVQRVVPISGDKTFNYVFLCHEPGNFTIPPIYFSYFDITTKTYKTIGTNPLPIKVLAVSKNPAQPAVKEEPNLPLIFTGIAKYVLPVLAAGLVLYLFILFMLRRKRKQDHHQKQEMSEDWERILNETTPKPKDENGQIVIAKSEPPHKSLADERYMPASTAAAASIQENTETRDIVFLPQAESALWMPDHKIFYQALKNDLLHAMAGSLDQPVSGRTALILALHQRGTDTGILQQIGIILDECDAAIYSPVYNDTNRRQTMEEAKYLIGKI